MGPFKLAALRRYQPQGVVPERGTNRLSLFLLALAVVFNDLKGLMLFQEALAKDKPTGTEISGHAGQWRGLEIQLQRYTIALVHELLALVEAFAAEAQSPEITSWFNTAHPSVRKRWLNIVRVATGGRAQGDAAFTTVLVQIRNNVASHYYQPKPLVAGFRRHFFETPKSPANEAAYASLGRNMDETRFYYADAALQGAIAIISGSIGEKKFARRLRRLGSDINEALAHVLEEHLKLAGEI